MKANKLKPVSVKRIVCPKCGELQLKLYPNSGISIPDNFQAPLCIKCANEINAKAR